MSDLRIRRATARDVPLLVRHRRAMWASIYRYPPAQMARADREFARWLRSEMRRKRIAAWVEEGSREDAVGSLLVWVRDLEPSPGNPAGRAPFLSTMYVEPDARRKGVGTALVEAAVQWCRKGGFPYVYGMPVNHARKLLRGMGFETMEGEMGLQFGKKVQH